MYGLTEAFRSTYLPPAEVDRRPDSIGKAIPNAEILVLREDGTPCDADEPGELVHRGALVGMGYWNDPREDRRALQAAAVGVAVASRAWCCPRWRCSPATRCKMDDEGFLYFIGRRDEMIKTSGYRVSPTEIEEALYATRARRRSRGVRRRAPDARAGDRRDRHAAARRERSTPTRCSPNAASALPGYMVPASIDVRAGPLPRNPNGKIDRKALALRISQERHAGLARMSARRCLATRR